jgi:potassium/sodium efflux P-type ATPase
LPVYARAVRDDQEARISAEELVPGDVVLVAEGDRISADARLVEAIELRVDQSTLTGESTPVIKSAGALVDGNPPPTERANIVLAGTSVTSGRGRAVIFATGMNTEFGRVASLTESIEDQPSPLQHEMARVSRVVSGLAVSIGLVFFALAVLIAGVNPSAGFIFAMGMIVAFVPEGMLPTVTLSLAMGVQRMARRNALVKRLSAVETLGSATVICTDKTGTITENQMTVQELWMPERHFTVSGAGYARDGAIIEQESFLPAPVDGDLRELLLAASSCTSSRILLEPGADGEPAEQWRVEGDPTEAALQIVAAKGGIPPDGESPRAPRIHEIPFDAKRRRMSTVHIVDRAYGEEQLQGASTALYMKGGPHEVLSVCSHVRSSGQDHPIDDAWRTKVTAANDRCAAAGLRVLAAAVRYDPVPVDQVGHINATPEELERDLTFLGLLAMRDVPRPEVHDAVEKCHRAGIRIVMITGDYGLTAQTIARDVGIVRSDARVITGVDIDAMDASTLQDSLRDATIVARATPQHKLRVVAALQQDGHIVAVTGDGVNDAPALKKADIGVAMGRSGTDVAREAADMVLADDNFASIVAAIEEGRAVFANIRRFAVYVFNSNMAEAVPFVAMLFSRGGIPLPLTIMQVLAIDLGTDMVPAIGLGAEQPERDVMDRPPRSQDEPLLTRQILARALLWYGAIESVASMAGYFFLNWLNGWPVLPLAPEGTDVYRMATTMTFAGVVAAQAGAVFGCRTDRASVFHVGFFRNRLVLFGVLIELALLALIVYVPPLQSAFGTAPIGLTEWIFIFAWTPVIFFADEARKAWLRSRGG